MSLVSGWDLLANSTSAIEVNQSESIALITLLFPVSVLGLLGWAIILLAIFRDRLYADPDNLLIISFGVADSLLLCYTLAASIQQVIYGKFAMGYTGCVIETFIITVAFCASGMHVVIISIDRYLLMCHGFHKTWSKTLILLWISWGVSLVFPSLAMFSNLPDFVLLLNGMVCIPNFVSRESGTRGWLIFALVLIYIAFATIIFSYSAVYIKYTRLKMKIFERQNQLPELEPSEAIVESSHDDQNLKSPQKGLQLSSSLRRPRKRTLEKPQLPPELSSLALKLLFKFLIICGTFFICFLPLTIVFIDMVAFGSVPNEWTYFVVTKLFECTPLANALLLYNLDAKMKRSVNEMLFGDAQIPRLALKRDASSGNGSAVAKAEGNGFKPALHPHRRENMFSINSSPGFELKTVLLPPSSSSSKSPGP